VSLRLPTGTAHALGSRGFPVAVMGKTGTTSEFRDALFAGSTYGVDGITVSVRIGFDDNRSLGSTETGNEAWAKIRKETPEGTFPCCRDCGYDSGYHRALRRIARNLPKDALKSGFTLVVSLVIAIVLVVDPTPAAEQSADPARAEAW
jgi:membrane peptidoglycan carboxypeptidase